MKTISIITNKKVDKTFQGEECLLRRTINKLTKVASIRRYSIVTDRCNFVTTKTPITEEIEIVDEDNNPTGSFEIKAVLDENGSPTYNEVVSLVSLGLKDSETTKMYNETQADALFEIIKTDVGLDNGLSCP